MPDPLILTMTAFLRLADQCGDGIAPATLANLQAHESGFSVIYMYINGGKNAGTVKGIRTKTHAIAYAKLLYAKGVNFDAGIAQINSKNFKWLGVTPETVFDPCESIKAQSRLLRSYSLYNTGNAQRGFTNGYVNKIQERAPAVREAMRIAEADVSRGTPPPPVPPPPLPPVSVPTWDVGGSIRDTPVQKPTEPRKVIVKEYP